MPAWEMPDQYAAGQAFFCSISDDVVEKAISGALNLSFLLPVHAGVGRPGHFYAMKICRPLQSMSVALTRPGQVSPFMKSICLGWLLILTVSSAFSQRLSSKVYRWDQAPVSKHTGYEDRTLVEGTTRDFNDFSVHALTVFPNQPAQPVQQLDEELMVIVKEGELSVLVVGKRKTLGPGSIVLIMPGDAYCLENKSSKPLTYYVMRYTSNEVPDLDLYQMPGESFWVDWKEVPFQAHDKGGIRRMFDRATVMTKRFEMHVTTLKAGLWSHPLHTHRAAEILLLIENKAQESIDGILQPAGVGDVIFLESDVPHAIQNTSQESCTYFAFQFE